MTFHAVSITDFERKMDGFGMSKSIKSNTQRRSWLAQSGSQSGLKNQLTLNLMVHFISPFQATSSR